VNRRCALLVLVAACGGGGGGGDDDGGGPVVDGAPPPPMCADGGVGGSAATTPGAITVPHPTLRNLTVEWAIEGDDDLDGTVAVRYRETGAESWRQGTPLVRVPAGTVEGFSWANRHSGSVFDLEPDTEYEVELYLSDPDGGCAVEVVTARTRPVPAPMAGAPVIPVDPGTFAAAAADAAPGDILELEDGTYAPFSFDADGAPGQPIVIRGGAGAIIDGEVSLIGRSHVHLVGVTVRGRIRLNLTTEVAVMGTTVETSGDGIVAGLRSENDYIADNTVTGATIWAETSLGVDGDNIGEGILVTGPGHVIEHNRVRGFRDAISFLEDSEADDQWSIDVIENDIEVGADDGIEADFCFHNCRILRNRLTNCFIAMSSQPGLGGPTWFVRNVAYNVILSAFKLQRGSVGDVLLHNTIVKNGDAFGIYTTDVFSRVYARNNLFLGGPGGTFGDWSSGSGRVMDLEAAGASCDLDHDGYGSTLGTFTGSYGAFDFTSLDQLRGGTTEVHAVEIDLGDFTGVSFPADPFPELGIPDIALASDSAAIDVGVAIPGINDDHAGAAPDLGARELGAPLPAYGPR
jgi:hypothetical protein